MTFFGRVITFFPLAHILLIALSGLELIAFPSAISLMLLFFSIYAIPLLFYRIHHFFCPLQEGISRVDLPKYCPWWGTHQIQALFNAFPSLEALLRLIPGFYSFWLRLWGSQIGRRVHWTSLVEVIDRGLLHVGDDVVFGHKVIIASHTIFKKKESLSLYVKKVQIGSGSFIGAGSKFGPGTVIGPHQIIPFDTLLTINKRV